jgi:murein DD-endopeptidase MepM/ murein hydrolase activator NlpD
MQQIQRDSHHPPQRRPALGVVILVGALALTLAAALIAFWPSAEPDPPSLAASTSTATAAPLGIAAVSFPTAIPTRLAPPTPLPLDWIRPTAAAGEIAAALNQPVDGGGKPSMVGRSLNPLTIIPWRSRSGIMLYQVKKGDSLRSIADKFGIEQNTIIWSNDRFYVNAMRVGLELNILPVNGVHHRVQEPLTIAQVAEQFKVDPYAIIDSEYNALFGSTPQTVLPAGLYVVVPGGTGPTEPIYWDPGIVMATSYTTDGSNPVGAGISVGSDTALFAVGDPGSCGKQVVSGGSPPVGAPIWDSYTISQDFSWSHGGIDLAVPSGTRVYAAGSGTVIFKGFSTWGYGYTVVIAHGSTLSLYGHLNGAFVGCGQIVSAGQNIAVTGNSGRSSGPHLHFEIRGANGAPVNPWDYQSF